MDVATPLPRRRPPTVTRLVRRLAIRLEAVRGELEVNCGVKQSLAAALRREVSPAEAANSLAQAIVCGSAVAASRAAEWDKCRAWLWDQSAAWERFVLERIAADDELTSSGSFSELAHLYEQLLSRDQPDCRQRAGVFFTPQPIVRYMLREIDARLREEFSLPLGLADDATWGQVRQRDSSVQLPGGARGGEPFVKLFDPAVGTGAFLLDAIDLIQAALTSAWREKGLAEAAMADRWNEYVPRSLLPRLWGMELLAAPCLLARLHVALKLAMTGYRFGEAGRIEIHLGNTLAGPTPPSLWRTRSASADYPLAEQVDHFAAAYDVPFTVVLGNPPFSYLSENKGDWITALVRGGGSHAGYLQADGQKLVEKKTWLHDDYVKFFRYSQWRIETTGCGVIALVTNHGYLTNATFRLMRQQLLRAFPRILVVDLHGNRKAREAAPDGERDENVFGLDQGIAIGIFRRPPGNAVTAVEHAELWGSREAKLNRLSVGQVSNLSKDSCEPEECEPGPVGNYAWQVESDPGHVANESYVPPPPDYWFAPAAAATHGEYAAAPAITEIFKGHATAPVTARDHFVVAFTRTELRERIEAFRDLSIPDDEIRRRYFTRTRSPRYISGDTRSWKLSSARKLLAAIGDWEAFIQPCQYRPLDWRWVFWHPAMIDWPRLEVTRHLAAGTTRAGEQEGERGRVGAREKESSASSRPLSPSPTLPLALIARRQLPPGEPATYFWATTALTLDGIIRSDNRGSESLFPLAEESLERAAYAYALFHSPTYRQRYAAALRRGFPHVILARDRRLTATLAELGRRLIALHTQRPPEFAASVGWNKLASRAPAQPASMRPRQRSLLVVAPGFPRYDSGRVWIHEGRAIALADEATWQFRVGAHQVARKWLADRRRRQLSADELAWYAIVLDTIVQTRALSAQIAAVIDQHGGFPAAFA